MKPESAGGGGGGEGRLANSRHWA